MQVTWSVFQRLNEGEIQKHVPERAGIYLLWVKSNYDKWTCYYVGQAEDLNKRLLDHCSPVEPNDCVREKGQNYVCGYEYAEVVGQAYRDGIVTFLFEHYKPQCNKQDPDGTPIPINLP